MKSLLIMKPEKPVDIVGRRELARLLTPNPKEAASTATWGNIALDYGVPVTIDTAYLGYHNGGAGQQWAVGTTNSTGNAIIETLVPTQVMQSPGIGTPYHGFYRADAPLTSRYWLVQTNGGPSAIAVVAGVLALGLSWSAAWGHEWGAGRFIEDTGTAERLFGGGFGIDDGVAAGGYQWTFGDLQPEEVDPLWLLVKNRRTTRSVLVVEDPERSPGLNERIHWGLFRKLEPFERLDPLNTKWSLSVGDWA